MPDRKFGWTVPVLLSSWVLAPVGPDQDVVGGPEVRGHRADRAQLGGAGGRGQHAERGDRDEHPQQQGQRPGGPEAQLRPGQSAHW